MSSCLFAVLIIFLTYCAVAYAAGSVMAAHQAQNLAGYSQPPAGTQQDGPTGSANLCLSIAKSIALFGVLLALLRLFY